MNMLASKLSRPTHYLSCHHQIKEREIDAALGGGRER